MLPGVGTHGHTCRPFFIVWVYQHAVQLQAPQAGGQPNRGRVVAQPCAISPGIPLAQLSSAKQQVVVCVGWVSPGCTKGCSCKLLGLLV